MMMVRRVRALAKSSDRQWRGTRMFLRGLHSAKHPLVANIVPVRRCNLSCTYCNQFDNSSTPVPTDVMMRRIDKLMDLGTSIITFTGGEPLLHPQLADLVAHVRRRGGICTTNTNGYLLSADRIRQFNEAGLDYMLISIDNVEPDDASKKSLRLLDAKLAVLAREAQFAVVVNSVLGADVRQPEDVLTIAGRARSLGFTSTLGIAHAAGGSAMGLDPRKRDIYDRFIAQRPKSLFSFAQYDLFQRNLIEGRPNDWHCGAGGRFLYVCEDGYVHYCSQQRGTPDLPLEQYGPADLAREGATVKSCAPFCTIPCVHETALVDRFRRDPRGTLNTILDSQRQANPGFTPPLAVRALTALFLDSPWSRRFADWTVRLLRLDVKALDH